MKKLAKLTVLIGAAAMALSIAGPVRSAELASPTGADGANANGTERVCGNGDAKSFAETYANCKRGDIIGLGRASPAGIMSICDFSKTILYTRGEAIACVYTGYLSEHYSTMRRGVVPHEVMVDEDNVMALADFDYVFLCVDRSEVRQLVLRELANTDVAVIDVGMGLNLSDDQESIWGTCRVAAYGKWECSACCQDQRAVETLRQHPPTHARPPRAA